MEKTNRKQIARRLILTISTITVNVNGPNIPSEKAKIARFDIKATPNSADYKKHTANIKTQ